MYGRSGLLAIDIASKLPLILIGFCALALAIAFAIGFCKGGYKVGKGGLFWIVATVGFIVCYKLLAPKNPLDTRLPMKIRPYAGAIWGFALLSCCAIGGLLLRGLCALLFRDPMEKENVLKGVKLPAEQDIEEEKLLGGALAPRSRQRYKRRRRRKGVGFLGRTVGGCLCAVNTGAVLAVFVGLFLLVVGGTRLSGMKIGLILQKSYMQAAYRLTAAYLFDYIAVGILFALVCKGYEAGIFGTLRFLLSTVGILGVIGLGFALPFIPKVAKTSLFNALITRVAALFGGRKYAWTFGKWTTGALLAIAGVLLVLLLIWLLKKGCNAVDETLVMYVVDGAFAVLVYLLVGVAICALLVGAGYALDYVGICSTSRIFGERAAFLQECLGAAERALQSMIDKVLAKLRG